MKFSKTTSIDIAAQAGVSQSTVSRALRGSPLVHPETRRRIQDVANEMGYSVDRSARSLRAKDTRTLALLLCEDPGWGEARINPFFLAILSSVAHAAAKRGYDLLLTFQQLSENWVADFQDARRADGLILLGIRDRQAYDAQLADLIERGTPFVTWGYEHHLRGVSSSVTGENRASMRELTAHLIKLGRRRIAFIGHTTDANPEFARRYEGYLDALSRHHLSAEPELRKVAGSSEKEGHMATTELMEAGYEFDAIVCVSDLLAIGAMAALHEHRRRVPEDVAVVGFDDLPIARYIRPPLTTIHQNTRRAGELLVEQLIGLIAGELVEPRQLPLELVVRESCGSHLG